MSSNVILEPSETIFQREEFEWTGPTHIRLTQTWKNGYQFLLSYPRGHKPKSGSPVGSIEKGQIRDV